jgi:hypothetical protein
LNPALSGGISRDPLFLDSHSWSVLNLFYGRIMVQTRNTRITKHLRR